MADAPPGSADGALDGATYMGFVPVLDTDAARSFYVGVLGLACLDESPFAIVVDARGVRLRLTPVGELRAQPFTIAGWEVSDIDASVDALAAAGVAFLRFDGIEQDARGIWHTPGGDRVAWFSDPDGNTLSLTTFANR